MHRALLVCDAANVPDSSLNAVLGICGFEVVESMALPADESVRSWPLVVGCCTGPDGRVSHSLWVPVISGAPVTGTSTAPVVLREPVTLADLTLPLLALGFTALTQADLDGLYDRLDELASHDETIVTELVVSLLATNEGDLAGLRTALLAAQADTVSSFAHRLKSSARMLGCFGLVAGCEALERRSASEDPRSALALIAWIASALNVLNTRLREELPVRRARARER